MSPKLIQPHNVLFCVNLYLSPRFELTTLHIEKSRTGGHKLWKKDVIAKRVSVFKIMGQSCSWLYCSCWTNCPCCQYDSAVCGPRYARYQSDDVDVDLENIVGDLLELDPLQYDRESGTEKINAWIEGTTPHVRMPPSFIAISRAKCIKYWQVLQTKPAAKLSGSFVRFCFEKRPNGELPRLLIEHKGKSVIVRSPQDRDNLKSKVPEVRV